MVQQRVHPQPQQVLKIQGIKEKRKETCKVKETWQTGGS